MNSFISDIESINSKLMLLLSNIQKSSPEDESVDKLVSDLQVSVETRQALLQGLLADKQYADREFLEQQFDFTQTLIKQSNKVMHERQALLQKGNSNKRQINIYKSIDSNR
ncbi:flagella biosynthesis chaperone for FliD, FliT [Shewanella sp. OMA3-2]|uniref:flagella biosynthesis chaperone for FliD, FliT n=1 Tax=Shewanella sp. OMA3-2 TaxID=2908650 RepID=UPI001F19D780|nr:flagella biosynthesis chaperone for FliD, FliT [Shewanella sp. OMA3-2]UJF21308.1 flagella biosynthesis chaperone for FliD, FliT [Shewanella sp. OMA3-2]